MGLSGRKIKQRIPQDPRNLSWADDASRFGSTYLSKLGFDHTDKDATLGISGVGLTQHLKVHHKLDVFGIGAQHTKDPNGIAWKQNRDFENLLKRLNADSEHPTGEKAGPAPIDGFQPARADGLAADATAVGSGTKGRDEERKMEKERGQKKKKRRRDASETSQPFEKASKKRKRAESTTAAPDTESVDTCPSSSNMLTREATTTARKYHHHGRAHRARFIASKRLAATSSAAVAEILGIPSSSAASPSVSGVTTPEVTPQVEDDEHEHLTVSSKSVADYFKEKMRHIVSKPSGSETEADGAPRGGIGSRLEFRGHDEVEGGGVHGGLGMRLLAKMSAAEAMTQISTQEEIPTGNVQGREGRGKRKHQTEDGKGEATHQQKRGNRKARTVSD